MKKYITFLLILVVVSSCFKKISPIRYQTDEYRNTETASFYFYVFPEERPTDLISAYFTFYREKQHQNTSAKIFVTLNRNSNSFSVQDSFFLVIDAKKYAMLINNKTVGKRLETKEETESKQINDSTSITVVTGVSTSTWKEEQFIIELNQKQLAEIAKSNLIKFRFYSGPSFGTFIIKDKYLHKVKELYQSF